MTPDPLDVIEAVHSTDGMAELIRAYYESLMRHGFDAKQALDLTIAWQTAIIVNPGSSG